MVKGENWLILRTEAGQIYFVCRRPCRREARPGALELGSSCSTVDKTHGVGVILKKECVNSVVEVKIVSDRTMSLKLEIEGVMFNVPHRLNVRGERRSDRECAQVREIDWTLMVSRSKKETEMMRRCWVGTVSRRGMQKD